MLYKHVTRSLLSAARRTQIFSSAPVTRGYHATKAGPPKCPLSNLDLALYGGGFILGISIVPFWATRQVTKWSEIHNRVD